MATATVQRQARRRGRTATHDPETLLDLIGEVARADAAVGEAVLAERVSMPAFNRVKLDADRARGLTDLNT